MKPRIAILELVASIPQSVVAWTNHCVFIRAWLQCDGPEFRVLAHGHDAVIFEYAPSFNLDRLRELLTVEWDFMPPIPFDVNIDGDNWYTVC